MSRPSLFLLALLALVLGSGPAAASAAGFDYSPEGYTLQTPVGAVVVAKDGYLLIVDWAAGDQADPGDDTFSVQNTLSLIDATVKTRETPYWDSPDAPMALDASLRSLSAPNPAFALLREADAGVLDRVPAPLDLYVGQDGVDVGGEALGGRQAGDDPLPYPTAESADLPVSADADSVDLPASWSEDTDQWLLGMDQVVVAACAPTAEEVPAPKPDCQDLATFGALQPMLPNIVFRNELQDLGVHVNPTDAGGATVALPLVGVLGPLVAGGAASALPGATLDEALGAGDDALAPDVPAPRAEPRAEGSELAPASWALGSPRADDVLLAVLALAAGAGLVLLAVPLYRRIMRGQVLENDVRGRILTLVQAKPGLHESAVAKELAISHTLAQYHVRMLAEFGLVEVRRFGGRKCLFAAGQMGRGEKTMILAEQGRGAQVVDLVAAQPRIAQRELARALGIRESSVKWHLDRLEQAGVVAVERSLDGKRVRLTEEAERTRMASFTRVAAPAAVPPAAAPVAPTAPAHAATAAPPAAEA